MMKIRTAFLLVGNNISWGESIEIIKPGDIDTSHFTVGKAEITSRKKGILYILRLSWGNETREDAIKCNQYTEIVLPKLQRGILQILQPGLSYNVNMIPKLNSKTDTVWADVRSIPTKAPIKFFIEIIKFRNGNDMITFALTRPTRAEAVSELLGIFARSAWLNLLVSRMEMAFSDAGGVITARVTLWGDEARIRRELQEAGIR